MTVAARGLKHNAVNEADISKLLTNLSKLLVRSS